VIAIYYFSVFHNGLRIVGSIFRKVMGALFYNSNSVYSYSIPNVMVPILSRMIGIEICRTHLQSKSFIPYITLSYDEWQADPIVVII
jgi:hypothetical protein